MSIADLIRHESVSTARRHPRQAVMARTPPLIVVGMDLTVLAVSAASLGAPVAISAFGVAIVAYSAIAGDYRCRITYGMLEDLPRVLAALCVVAFADEGVTRGIGTRDPLAVLVATVGAFLFGRLVASAAIRLARRRRWLVEPVVILGAGDIGRRLAASLIEHGEFGLSPVGFLDQPTSAPLPAPILGDIDALPEVLGRSGARRVIVAYGLQSDPDIVRTLRYLRVRQVDVHMVPRFFELGVLPRGLGVDNVWGIPLSCWHSSSQRTASLAMKRLLDIVVAAVGLLVLGIPLLILALAVRISGGPAFFRQRRVGRNGRAIDVIKLRTMSLNEDSDTTWSVANDNRTTALGRFLRRTSIDELPQLWNVLRGDMSLVGPRPERPVYVELFTAQIQGYEDRHRFPVGLTGWAQIHGLRGDSSIADRAVFDNQYIENWSLWQDLIILVRTLLAVPRAAWGGERCGERCGDSSSPGGRAGSLDHT